jgi:putative ABC transport system substrate-binding protein
MRKAGVLSILFAVVLFAVAVIAEAQQQVKVPKIGYLSPVPSTSSARFELLRREFRKLGYVEGKNIAFEFRSTDNKIDRLPAAADELVRLKVDVLIAPGTPTALAAKNASRTIPIVFTGVADPIPTGLVDSLPRPGGILRGSRRFRRYWLANGWSYSRNPLPNFLVSRCYGIRAIQAMHNSGRRAKSPPES